jgi:hypothetical protein
LWGCDWGLDGGGLLRALAGGGSERSRLDLECESPPSSAGPNSASRPGRQRERTACPHARSHLLPDKRRPESLANFFSQRRQDFAACRVVLFTKQPQTAPPPPADHKRAYPLISSQSWQSEKSVFVVVVALRFPGCSQFQVVDACALVQLRRRRCCTPNSLSLPLGAQHGNESAAISGEGLRRARAAERTE